MAITTAHMAATQVGKPRSSPNPDAVISTAPVPAIPNEAILIRLGKPLVAIIDHERVHLQPITLGDTDGRSVRVDRGLHGGETIGINVPIEVEEGSAVRPVVSPPAPGGPAIGGGPSSSSPHDAGAPDAAVD